MERNKSLEEMLIKFYNMQAGTGFRCSNQQNLDKTHELLEACDGDVPEAKNRIRNFVRNNPELAKNIFGITNCITYRVEKISESAPSGEQVKDSLGLLEKALIEVIKSQSIPQIEKDIKSECEQMLKDYIAKEYGTIERKIVTIIDGERKETPGVMHEEFDTVIKYVSNNLPVFLVGPAGSGKNHLCKQVADALGLDFYFTNAVTQEYKLTGFTDANGHYQPTQFYKAFKDGGLFMLDEMDASIPDVLNILNAAIANKYFDFPAPIGFVKAHPNFRVIAAGNTIGHGADYEYVGRNQLDAATLDRFAPVYIGYCAEIENNIACDIELADFCRAFRKSAEKAGIRIIVSYRAIDRLAKMTKLLDLPKALSTGLVKGLEKDDLNIIIKDLPDSKYKDALKKIA